MILLCYALETLVNNIINRSRMRETSCRVRAGGRSPGIPHRRGGQAAYTSSPDARRPIRPQLALGTRPLPQFVSVSKKSPMIGWI